MTKSQKISLILFILSFASIEIASVLMVVIGRFLVHVLPTGVKEVSAIASDIIFGYIKIYL